ncbi:MAG: pyridoxal-phosphate dependent enzyme [Candidatus Krumholzibacteriota bacterium]|nr:pyridoxal-phosphate dependent enzyme [Candidatus Krumholzibacteriota bacterium]
MHRPAINEIREASKRIAPYIHNTPVLRCQAVDNLFGREVFFKCENFQKSGAFKIRGAANAVFSLEEDEAEKGVATHSSGNHGAALALAARARGVGCYVVMPENAPGVKVKAVSGYGADISFCKPTLKDRERVLKEVADETGAVFIHPSNNSEVIAGQGTAALEFLEEVPDIDALITPVGGGGLLSGSAISTTAVSPETAVIAAEPKGADDAFRSFKSGKLIPSENPETIADGLLTSLSDLTFSIIRKYVSDIVTVSEENIVGAMRLIWERMKIVVEPSAAVALAAMLESNNSIPGKRVGIILSGGNVDLNALPFSGKD